YGLIRIAGAPTGAQFKAVMDDRQPLAVESHHAEWDMWLLVRAFPVREGGISIYFHDITAAKAAEATLKASEADLQRTLDSISDVFLIVDTEWRFTYLNAAVRRLWKSHGIDPDAMIGENVLTAFDGVARTIFEKELRRTLVLRIPTRFEYHYAPWGRWFSCRCYPIADGGASLYLLDITAAMAAEQGLRASEDYLSRLVESIGNRMAVLDTEWRYRFMNAGARAAAEADGQNPDDMLGEVVWDVYPGLLGTPFEENLRAAMYDRVASAFEVEQAGRWLMMNVFPVAGDGITLYGQDITAQKALETALRDSEMRWRTLTDAMPQIVWIARAETGEYTYVNDRCVRYTGAPAEAFLGAGWEHFIHPDDREHAREEWRLSFERSEVFDVEFRMRRFDGQFRWFKVRGVPMPDADGRYRLWYGTCTDIQDMMEARFQAESADRAKSEFLANISHEIRTPLNAIVGLTSLLLRFNADAPTQRKYFTTMKDSASSLTALIGDVLDYARMDFGQLELQQEEFRVVALLGEVIRIAGVKADEKGLQTALHTDIDPGLTLIGDALRIRQILLNLTANAVKFTPAGRVDVVAVASPAEDGRLDLAVTVKDTGIGIAADKLDCIFETFTQADSSITRRFGGTGLGLAISRRLTEGMGGTLSVTSAEGAGSAFTLRLKLPVADVRPAAVVEPAKAAGALRVLLVEDNAINAMVAGDMLTRLGHSYEIAGTGRDALRAWREKPFDAVLMDVQMPDMDGVQATRRIRQMERAEKVSPIPIVAMTALAANEDREMCLAAGMDAYLAKPFTVDALADA
ncbi:MAG: PAS domain-containing protein, partial [Asticcacaulis sp.]|nr:PAS domain-containing protein [Asticcacaulis sp.]